MSTMEGDKKPYQPTEEEMKKAEGMVPDEFKERDKYREEAFSAGEKKGEIEENDKNKSRIGGIKNDIRFLKEREESKLAEEKKIIEEEKIKSVCEELKGKRYKRRVDDSYGPMDYICDLIDYDIRDGRVTFYVDARSTRFTEKFTENRNFEFVIKKDELLSLLSNNAHADPEEIWKCLWHARSSK